MFICDPQKVIIGTAACFLCSALAIAVISLLSAAALKPGTWVFTDNTELGTFSPGSEEYVDLVRFHTNERHKFCGRFCLLRKK